MLATASFLLNSIEAPYDKLSVLAAGRHFGPPVAPAREPKGKARRRLRKKW